MLSAHFFFAARRTTTALFLLACAGHAENLVLNGGFDSSTNGAGQLGYNTVATDWTTTGYNFLFAYGAADSTGATGQYGSLYLYGPGNGYENGLPESSPDGGNFVGADGAYDVGAISQTIYDLNPGDSYDLTFYWAAAQQSGYGCLSPANPGGCTTDQFKVSLGNQTFSTPVASTGENKGGFSGWMQQTFTFTPNATSEVLSFLAVGTPGGEPPFALLDGVNMMASTPEPGTIALIAGATLIVGARLVGKKIGGNQRGSGQ